MADQIVSQPDKCQPTFKKLFSSLLLQWLLVHMRTIKTRVRSARVGACARSVGRLVADIVPCENRTPDQLPHAKAFGKFTAFARVMILPIYIVVIFHTGVTSLATLS